MTAADPVHGHEITSHPFATGWDWETRDGEHFRCCTYCGSIHPDDLAAEAAWVAEWADPKYGWPHKFYVDITNRDPDRLYVISSSNSEREPDVFGARPWTRFQDAPQHIRDTPWYRSHPPTWVQLGPRENHYSKFYTRHLRDPRISDEVKDRIHQMSGLRFDWLPDGGVRWHRYDCTEDHPHE